ncbi:MAG TPA: hypothetical protein DDZ51_07850 [Planctomycetaceae bacterium]|nr:hypothetical protein [Planctomycetaceae bacterium]
MRRNAHAGGGLGFRKGNTTYGPARQSASAFENRLDELPKIFGWDCERHLVRRACGGQGWVHGIGPSQTSIGLRLQYRCFPKRRLRTKTLNQLIENLVTQSGKAL